MHRLLINRLLIRNKLERGFSNVPRDHFICWDVDLLIKSRITLYWNFFTRVIDGIKEMIFLGFHFGSRFNTTFIDFLLIIYVSGSFASNINNNLLQGLMLRGLEIRGDQWRYIRFSKIMLVHFFFNILGVLVLDCNGWELLPTNTLLNIWLSMWIIHFKMIYKAI